MWFTPMYIFGTEVTWLLPVAVTSVSIMFGWAGVGFSQDYPVHL